MGLEVVALGDLLDEPLEVAAVEGHRAVDEGVEQDAEGPAVHLGAVVRRAPHYLGGGVQGGAAERREQSRVIEHVGEAEICDLKRWLEEYYFHKIEQVTFDK